MFSVDEALLLFGISFVIACFPSNPHCNLLKKKGDLFPLSLLFAEMNTAVNVTCGTENGTERSDLPFQYPQLK